MSAYPSSAHLELLEAQYGIKSTNGAPTNETAFTGEVSNVHSGSSTSSPIPAGQEYRASSRIFVGRAYHNLRAYVEMAANEE